MTNDDKIKVLSMWGYVITAESGADNGIVSLARILGPGIDYGFVKADGDVTQCIQFVYERAYWYIWDILSNDVQ